MEVISVNFYRSKAMKLFIIDIIITITVIIVIIMLVHN